jgi:hypothetical protein
VVDVNDKQRDILRHALGVGRGRAGWRNHFVTGPGSDDYADCEALVAAGLMTKRSGGPLSGGDPVYRVTDAGQDLLVGRKTPNVRGNRPDAACGLARAADDD